MSRHTPFLAALVGIAAVSVPSGAMSGGPASTEDRERKRQAKRDLAPLLVPKAEAKRARKAAIRAALSSSSVERINESE